VYIAHDVSVVDASLRADASLTDAPSSIDSVADGADEASPTDAQPASDADAPTDAQPFTWTLGRCPAGTFPEHQTFTYYASDAAVSGTSTEDTCTNLCDAAAATHACDCLSGLPCRVDDAGIVETASSVGLADAAVQSAGARCPSETGGPCAITCGAGMYPEHITFNTYWSYESAAADASVAYTSAEDVCGLRCDSASTCDCVAAQSGGVCAPPLTYTSTPSCASCSVDDAGITQVGFAESQTYGACYGAPPARLERHVRRPLA
jgi:hypothetical protein